MMTTACAIIGTLPIAIGFGADADARRPLGLCVVGGLLFAQFVTLYLTPVFYTYMDNFLNWRRAGKRQVAPEAVGAGKPLLVPNVK
jgi:HAE1 family hydrophobic/amphiphilic exporter-1